MHRLGKQLQSTSENLGQQFTLTTNLEQKTVLWAPLTFHLQVEFSQWCSRCHMNIMKFIKDLGQLLLLSGRFLLFSTKK